MYSFGTGNNALTVFLKVCVACSFCMLHCFLHTRVYECSTMEIVLISIAKKLKGVHKTFCPITPIWQTPHRNVKLEVSV